MCESSDNIKEDILRPLSNDEFEILLNLYKKSNKYSISVYLFILNHLKWIQSINKSTNKRIISDKCLNTFYTHRDGDLITNGTFICISGEKDYSVMFYTLQKDLSELRESIFLTNLIKYKINPIFCNVHLEHIKVLYDYVKTKNIKMVWENFSACYFLEKSIAANYEYNVPENVKLLPLSSKDAITIDSVWPHKYPDSDIFITNMINFNGGLGLYSVEDGKLLSWIIKNEFNGIGLLQTIDSERRQGFGKILTKVLSKKIALEDNSDVIAFILSHNKTSQSLFYSLGFTKERCANWLQYKSII